jgi:hypothetical protein
VIGGMVFCVYFIGQGMLTPIICLTVIPFLIFGISKIKLPFRLSESIEFLSVIICGLAVLCAMSIGFSYSKYQVYLDGLFMNGKLSSEERRFEDEDGREGSTTEYYFENVNSNEHYKENLIIVWMALMIFATPFYAIVTTEKIQRKIKNEKAFRRFNDLK